MTNKKTNVPIIGASVVLILLFLLIFWLLPNTNSRFLFGYSLVALFIFVVAAYSPHAATERENAESMQPVLFFTVGTILIVTGCAISNYFSQAMSHLKTLGQIGEIGPLILGAVVGGNYCCDSFLGQKFNGKVYKLEWGWLLLIAPIIIIIALFSQINNYSWISVSTIIVIGFAPLIALAFLRLALKLTMEKDTAFWAMVIGFSLIVAAILGTMILLDAIYLETKGIEPYSPTPAFTFVKNLVPAYCASIGAGLILRAVQENVTPFSMRKWAEKHFIDLKLENFSENELVFSRELKNPIRKQTIEVKIGITLIDALKENAFERNLYGAAAKEWLSKYINAPRNSQNAEIKADLPNAENLRKRKKVQGTN